jgi:hypothetical protein
VGFDELIKALFDQSKHPRAPKGGVTIQGKFYRGGQMIPKEVMAKATAAEKAKLVQGGQQAPAKGVAKPATAKKQAQPPSKQTKAPTQQAQRKTAQTAIRASEGRNAHRGAACAT